MILLPRFFCSGEFFTFCYYSGSSSLLLEQHYVLLLSDGKHNNNLIITVTKAVNTSRGSFVLGNNILHGTLHIYTVATSKYSSGPSMVPAAHYDSTYLLDLRNRLAQTDGV